MIGFRTRGPRSVMHDEDEMVGGLHDHSVTGVRIKTHPGLCAGWGNCHRFAPDLYPLDDDGHVAIHLMEAAADRAYDARLGALACPAGAITVITSPDHLGG
jgi:ferredoxin